MNDKNNEKNEYIYEGEIIEKTESSYDSEVLYSEGLSESVDFTEKKEPSDIIIASDDDSSEWNIRHKKREAIRESIKQRVRNSSTSNEYFHPGKPVPKINDDSKKRVSVYARVSTLSLEQTSSIENQQKFYTKKVNETPNWELKQIYSDEGKSGTNAEHRPAFQQMIKDALNGEMDMIICASVSRFARNISQCLDYVSELRTANPKHPVGVYFETENIYTLNPDCEQAFTMHAMLADWESANKSRRMILSYDQRICTGQYPVADLLGYRHTKDGQLIVQEDEAKTVKYIFIALILGKNCNEIAEELSKMKRKSLTGRIEWNGSMVKNITTNERRWGDLEARKNIVLDYKRKKIVKNNELRDWAYVPEHHEAIVSRNVAKAAQLMVSSAGLLKKGVPELKVIDSGVLKGYVSVIPHWNEVDSESYFKACNSAYSESELSELNREIRILTGKEKSNVLSMTFTGYEVPPGIVFLTNNMPSLTITNKGIKFNKACMKRLDNPDWIEMFYHPLLNSIIVRKADSDSVNSFKWKRDNGCPINNIETKAFSTVVYKNMDWFSDYSFKFRGILKERGDSKLLCFSLDEPQILVGKMNMISSSDKSRVHYIDYTNECISESVNDNIVAFPAEWKEKHIGRNVIMRKKRELTFTKLSEDDINEEGIAVSESVSSFLPNRKELEDELEELIKSM